jgi:hypothetical protein
MKYHTILVLGLTSSGANVEHGLQLIIQHPAKLSPGHTFIHYYTSTTMPGLHRRGLATAAPGLLPRTLGPAGTQGASLDGDA